MSKEKKKNSIYRVIHGSVIEKWKNEERNFVVMHGLRLLKREKMKMKEDWRVKVRVSIGKTITNKLKEDMDMFVL